MSLPKTDKIVMFRRIDGYEVKLVSEGWDQDLEEVCAMFRDFLAGAGFSLAEGDEVAIINSNDNVLSRKSLDTLYSSLKRTE